MTDRDARLAVTALSSLHQETCKRSHCFTRANLNLAYFCVLPSDLEDDCVPDSLQVGHGLRLELPYCFKSFFINSSVEIPDGLLKRFMQSRQFGSEREI